MGLSNNLGKLSNMITSTGSAVGIAQTSPAYTLDVTGTVRGTTSAYFSTASGNVGIGTTSANKLGADKALTINGATDSLLELTVGDVRKLQMYHGGTNAQLNNLAAGSLTLITNGISALTLASTGAATFSSSITLNGNGTQANNTLFTLSNGYMYLDGNTNGLILENNSSSSTRIRLEAADNMQFQTASTERMRITSGGNVLINTTSDNGDKFQLKGAMSIGYNTTTDSGAAITGYFSNGTSTSYLGLGTSYGAASSGDIILNLNTTGKTIYVRNVSAGVYMSQGSTSWTANSDETIKDIIEPITNGLDKLKDLRTIIYKLKNDETNQRKIGLIAQDVEKVLPEAIVKSYQKEYDREILGLNYTDLIPVLINSVQELSQQNQELKERLDKAGL
jgi:uncharacterized protein YaiE (UPF0345 family)